VFMILEFLVAINTILRHGPLGVMLCDLVDRYQCVGGTWWSSRTLIPTYRTTWLIYHKYII
jgi:hypothetical protein